MARNTKIKCVSYFPDRNGGYKQLDELTEQEKRSWSDKIVNRMGNVLNNYFGQHPKEYIKLCENIR